MCGRFTLDVSSARLAKTFGIANHTLAGIGNVAASTATAEAGVADEASQVITRYNIAPTQSIMVVRESADAATAAITGRRAAERELVSLRWGLIPA